MVLGRDIAGRIEVSMQLIAAFPTDKATTGAPICTGGMPAAAACLRGMSRVDHDHRQAALLGLVLDKALELRERPGVDAALSFGPALRLRSLPNVLEVFQHDRRAWLRRHGNLFGEHMVAVATETHLLVAHTLEVAFGRLAALLLQRSLERKRRRYTVPVRKDFF